MRLRKRIKGCEYAIEHSQYWKTLPHCCHSTELKKKQLPMDHESRVLQVSDCYKISQGTSPPLPTLIEHCCLMTPGNKWDIHVKCRPTSNHIKGGSQQTSRWRSVNEVFPDAKVEQKHNDIEVTLPSLREDIEIAAFGSPGKDDQKRMQMAIFARRPTQGRDWKIWVYLVDDTNIACKKICEKEDERGNKLLAPFAGLFVSNSSEDIRIELSPLEAGWKIKGSNVKTIRSNDAWKSPENSNDFPCCHFEISHVNKTKQSFFCGIKTSHEGDNACAEIVAYFERERGRDIIQSSKNVQKLSNSCYYVSKEINAWLPALFFALFYLFASDFQTNNFTGSNPTNQHFMTKKVIPRETHRKLALDVFQKPRLKEVY